MKILPIPAFRDNYIWTLLPEQNANCVVVDPGDAQPVEDYLHNSGRALSAILITHHHADHCGGINRLQHVTNVPVYGPGSIEGITHPLKAGETFMPAGLDISLTVMEIPGHTLEHIAYYGEGCLFCGDTLFAAGCGRVFEGTSEQMLNSLHQLAALPPETLVYCAHEYTEANLRYAAHVEPDNPDIQKRIQRVGSQRQGGRPSLPSTLSEERLTNPFLRCKIPAVLEHAQKIAGRPLQSTVEVFTMIREEKNKF